MREQSGVSRDIKNQVGFLGDAEVAMNLVLAAWTGQVVAGGLALGDLPDMQEPKSRVLGESTPLVD
jgi:hypothetical protein